MATWLSGSEAIVPSLLRLGKERYGGDGKGVARMEEKGVVGPGAKKATPAQPTTIRWRCGWDFGQGKRWIMRLQQLNQTNEQTNAQTKH